MTLKMILDEALLDTWHWTSFKALCHLDLNYLMCTIVADMRQRIKQI